MSLIANIQTTKLTNHPLSSSSFFTMATLRSVKPVRMTPPPHHETRLTINSCRTLGRILADKLATVQAQSARACQGSEVVSQGLCADCEECVYHAHKHLLGYGGT